MKQRKTAWTIRLSALLLAGLCLCGGPALAAGGDQDDPLITLSYLTRTVTPDILEQVERQGEQYRTQLLERFNTAIEEFRQQNPGASGGEGGAAYTAVTLTGGQRLSLDAGSEVLLRSGSASVSSSGAPALTDLTSGASLDSGGALAANHLYLAPAAGRVVTASGAVQLMVRGGCAVL